MFLAALGAALLLAAAPPSPSLVPRLSLEGTPLAATDLSAPRSPDAEPPAPGSATIVQPSVGEFVLAFGVFYASCAGAVFLASELDGGSMRTPAGSALAWTGVLLGPPVLTVLAVWLYPSPGQSIRALGRMLWMTTAVYLAAGIVTALTFGVALPAFLVLPPMVALGAKQGPLPWRDPPPPEKPSSDRRPTRDPAVQAPLVALAF